MRAPGAALAATSQLLAAAADQLDLPPMPRPDEGLAALWTWLWAVNSQLSIPDPDFRWAFGGFTLAMLLLFELAGVRRTWVVYPFLLPFWLVFGSIALGVVGGVAAAAAHLVLFPVVRVWFILRDRRRARDAGPATPSPRAPVPPPLPARSAPEVLRAALEAVRAAAEERRRAAPAAAGQPGEPRAVAVLRALVAGIDAAVGARPQPPAAGRPPSQHPAHHAPRSDAATGAPPGRPDFTPFRPDLSRFRRRPP